MALAERLPRPARARVGPIRYAVCQDILNQIVRQADAASASWALKLKAKDALAAAFMPELYGADDPVQARRQGITAQDYVKVAAIAAKCPKDRLPYVLGLLEHGGFDLRAAARLYAAVIAVILAVLALATAGELVVLRRVGMDSAAEEEVLGFLASLWGVAGITLIGPLVACLAAYAVRYMRKKR